MPQPAKLLHIIGLLAKEEAVYGTAIALTTTADGVQLQFKDRKTAAPLALKYSYSGDFGPSVGALGNIQRVSPAGFSVEGDLPTRARPGGAAYSAVLTPSIHRLLKAAGFDATVTTSVGTEKWVYTPTVGGGAAAPTSLTLGLYTRGELWSVAGALGNIKFDFADPAPPIWTFQAKGIATLPADAAPPTITYPLATVLPPLASSITFVLGSLSANAVVMSGSFDMQRQLTPRVAVSAAGAHLGFVPGDRDPIFKVSLEATALTGAPYTAAAAFDPYNLRDKAQSFAASLQFGSVQYNKYHVNFAQAQVIDVVPNNNGDVATVELTIAAYNSSAVNGDDITITFD
jgi:hypothetical protein